MRKTCQANSLTLPKAHKVLGQGNFVLMMSEGLFDGKPTAFYDLHCLEEDKKVEHWDVLETMPPPAASGGGEEFQWQVLGRTCRNRVFLNEPVWGNLNPLSHARRLHGLHLPQAGPSGDCCWQRHRANAWLRSRTPAHSSSTERDTPPRRTRLSHESRWPPHPESSCSAPRFGPRAGPKFSHSRKGRSDGLDAVAQGIHRCFLVERRP